MMEKVTDTDRGYMLRAMKLAERGRGKVNPNPLVGAVIVKDGRVIGEGWHECYGGLHAERNAFRNCAESAAGATLYVTLEPCCHYGKTPPCTDIIIERGIGRVVVGLPDPNPLVAGKGIQLLQEAGIEVVCGVEEEALQEQNRVFLRYITCRKPWVALKTAMTLDGKIATHTGDSKWVTGEAAREYVQRLREEYRGIMVGIGTVLADDPMLNCRLAGEVCQPVRIVVDSGLRIPLECQLVRTAMEYRTLVACTASGSQEKREQLRKAGVEVVVCGEKEGKVDLEELMGVLGEMGIDGVLVEGGGELNGSLVLQGVVNEVYAFVAPKLVGGREAKTPVEGVGVECMGEAVELGAFRVESFGKDMLLRARVVLQANEGNV